MTAEVTAMRAAPITLRPFEERDFGFILASIRSADELLQWAGPELSWPLDEERLRAYRDRAAVGASEFLTFSADEQATGAVVGHVQLVVNRDHDLGQVARVLIAPGARGRGLGAALIGEVVRLAFDDLGLHRLSLNVFDGNSAAIACYERAGFVKEGHLRDVARASSGYWSMFVMGLLATDPRHEPGARHESTAAKGGQRE